MMLFREGMLWTYGKTGNKELLERCEQAWNRGKFSDLTPQACLSDRTLDKRCQLQRHTFVVIYGS